MTHPLLLAVRVQTTLDELAALKARPASERRAEQQLIGRLAEILAPVIDQVVDGVDSRGAIPGDEAAAQLLLGDLTEVEVSLFDVLTEEVGETAVEAIEHVEEVVAAATKALPDDLRPFGMNRSLFDTITNLGSRMLDRFTSRTVLALVDAADVGMPRSQLAGVLTQMLEGEVQQLSRHALGDVRNAATETAERQMGVTHHQWVTAGDDEVRPAHAAVDGEIAPVGERFSNGWRRPGGVGCRCDLEPVVQAA